LLFLTVWPGAGSNASCAPAPMETVSQPDRDANSPAIDPPRMDDPSHRDYPGLHNVVAYHDGYYSGSVPDGEAGFETLAGLGVKTIISVDGTVPDVAAAEARGMRYIHLPIGYDGFDETRTLELARATRDAIAIGPVYVHCHHGKHRSAGAAGTVAVTLGWATPDEMIQRMRVSGTSRSYQGLYACTANASAVSMGVLDDVPADFPSVSRPAGLVKGMVEIDEAMEHLRAIERAGWKVPPGHPDPVPAAEAGRLADLIRFLEADHRVRAKPAAFADGFRASRDAAQQLEDLLAAGESDAARLSDRLGSVAASCTQCHVAFRD